MRGVGGMRGGSRFGGGGGGGGGGGMFGDDIFTSFGDGRTMSSAPRKAALIESTLPCSLEELYERTTKKMKISREIADASGQEGSGESEDISNLCLIGKLLAPKTLNKAAVAKIIRAAWRTRGELSISPWTNNIFLFQFTDGEDRHRVLRDSLWSVMRWLLALQPLSPRCSMEELDFK
ncbi:hypothetical protein ACSBR2_015666 [Camellia fascicularis]